MTFWFLLVILENIINYVKEKIMEHSFFYEKNKIVVCGVQKVESFDEKEILIKLSDNVINIKGSDFCMQEMAVSSGKLTFLGQIHSFQYLNKIDKTSFIKKLFK